MMSKEEFVRAMMRNEEWKRNEKKRQERYKKRREYSESRSFSYDSKTRMTRRKGAM